MKHKICKGYVYLLLTLGFGLALLATVTEANAQEQPPITLKTMGSLSFGGNVVRGADGDTFHGDHGYAQFYIPAKARNYPLILWHGMGQSGKTWESTTDGREGYQAILTRDDWPVFIIDQPRRGRAGYTRAKADDSAIPTLAQESAVWNAFRNGVWLPPANATLFPGVQTPTDPASIQQFFRQQTPNTGEEPFPSAEQRSFMANTVHELLKRTGPAILVTHSHSGQYGWATAIAAPDLVKGIVAYEPGSFSFPEGERPADVPAINALASEVLQPQMVPAEEFKKLARMPIVIIFGDNIVKEPHEVFGIDAWRIASIRARQFVEAVNRHGGDAVFVSLPEIGIHGNTHVPFADLNSQEVAEHLKQWLHSKGLDARDTGYFGPIPAEQNELTIPLQRD